MPLPGKLIVCPLMDWGEAALGEPLDGRGVYAVVLQRVVPCATDRGDIPFRANANAIAPNAPVAMNAQPVGSEAVTSIVSVVPVVLSIFVVTVSLPSRPHPR